MGGKGKKGKGKGKGQGKWRQRQTPHPPDQPPPSWQSEEASSGSAGSTKGRGKGKHQRGKASSSPSPWLKQKGPAQKPPNPRKDFFSKLGFPSREARRAVLIEQKCANGEIVPFVPGSNNTYNYFDESIAGHQGIYLNPFLSEELLKRVL